jgi:succinate dehydrogenase/fumarate reductase flavoprotein subunit
MELVQFHPTALADRGGVLVTEAVLAEGGKFVDAAGKPVDIPTRAPRDVQARAIAMVKNGGVLLDASGIDAKKAGKALKYTKTTVQQFAGIDITKKAVPVAPAAHRFMGGIKTTLEGATTVAGLFAAGECAWTGAHGANRLGGNTLTEAVVFGKRAGAAAAKRAQAAPKKEIPANLLSDTEKRVMEPFSRPAGADTPHKIRMELQQLMDASAGIVRDGATLKAALDKAHGLWERFQKVPAAPGGKMYDAAVTGYLETRNLLICAEAVLASAAVREESRGTHARTDFPNRDDAKWLKHTLFAGGKVDTAPVTVTKWQPAVRAY